MASLAGSVPMMNWDSGDLPGTWKSFRSHVDFMFGGPLKGKTEAEKCNFLMLWVGERGRNVFETWALSDEDRKKLDAHYTKFENYVKPKSNQVFSRYKFQCRTQNQSEKVVQFITDLKTLVKDCSYTDSDEMVRDRIVFGTNSPKVREKLINEGSDLTLEKAIEIASTYELSQEQLKMMSGEDANINVVRQFQGRRDKSRQRSFNNSTDKQSQRQNVCGKCGYEHFIKQVCPAKGKQCSECKKFNHFASVCRNKSGRYEHSKQKGKKHKRKVNKVAEEDTSDTEETFFVGAIDTDGDTETDNDEWQDNFKVFSKTVNFELDTGAKCNVISTETLKSLGVKTAMETSNVRLRSYTGHILKVVGAVLLPLEYKDVKSNVKFQVVDGSHESILGSRTCSQMRLVARVNHAVTESTIPEDVLNGHPTLFEGLGCLPGEHTIKIDPMIPPVVHPPRSVPVSLKKQIKEELDRMQELGVIVKQEEPTSWVNSMVTVIKPKKIRNCIDPKDLNRAILREHFPLKTVEEVMSSMPGAKVFTKLDATSGFWLIKLSEESCKLCTFNTPFGRYRFTRLPFGIKSAPEVFQRVMSEMVQDINDAEVIMDDILIWGRTLEEHDETLKNVLDRAEKFNVKLSATKCEFRKSEVTYVGHLLTSKGVCPDPEKVRAVEEMSRPQNKAEVQTFLGFINYLSKFLVNMSEISAPLRQLLEKSTEWHWEQPQEKSFQKLKELATNAPILSFYDEKEPIVINVDASSKGLGAVLLQNSKPVAYGSRALTQSQQSYAQIEKETLAMVYGCKKFHHHVFGREIIIETDHKPLESIFKKPLLDAPARLQRLLMALQKYNITVKYKPGKEMVSDALSRLYLPEVSESLVPEIEINAVNLLAYLPVSEEKQTQLQQATKEDPVLQSLQNVVFSGWPNSKTSLPSGLGEYWSFRDEISSLNGLLFKSHKLIVPTSMRKEMLDKIHEPHMGIVKSKARGRDVLYWPGMTSQIEEMVSKCEKCALHQKANAKEPMITPDLPDRPWSKVATDLFEFQGEHYLLTLDYFSKWPEVEKLDNLGTGNVISYMKKQISKYGVPDEVVSDNGPQYSSSEFHQFSKKYGFTHTTSSPYYPRGNAQAERAVQTVKNLIRKASDPHVALLAYRNTPIEGIGLSPAQMFLGRRLKTSLPTAAPLLKPEFATNVRNKLQVKQQKEKLYYDNGRCKELPPLTPGDQVVFQHQQKWVPATVTAKHSSPRSYIVETASGKKYRRNRSQCKKTKASWAEHSQMDIQTGYSNQTVSSAKQQTDFTTPVDTNQTISVETPATDELVNVTRSGRIVKPPQRFNDFVTP